MRAVLSAPEPAAFRGPRIIVAALLSAAISLGCTLGIFGVFLGPLAEEFAAPKAQLALGNSLWQAAMGLGAPVVGWLLVRYSVRTFMAVGGCLLGVGGVARRATVARWRLLLRGRYRLGAVWPTAFMDDRSELVHRAARSGSRHRNERKHHWNGVDAGARRITDRVARVA
jgi:hypothetical protein